MIQYKKLMMTLALLLTAVTGAWADEPKVYTTAVDVTSLKVGDILAEGFSLTSTNPNGAIFNIADQRGKRDETIHPGGYMISTKNITAYGANATFTTADGTYYPIDENSNVGNAWVVTQECNQLMDMDLTIAGVTIELPLTVAWNAATKTGTFAMPASNVVLTPIYSEATVLSYDETETAYASLKEAFANLQDGDCIKLDWNVTLTEQLETPTIAGGADFTIDFNGYTISGDYGIYLNNVGDRLMFTDSSIGVMGGYQAGDLLGTDGSVFAFDAGRFKLGSSAAATLNEYCAVPENPWELLGGKEFTDLEGGAAANDGFTLLVDYKAIELTIGAGKFATFYGDYNTKFADGTDDNIGFYIISSVDDAHTTATVAQYNSDVVPGSFPVLVYNGTGAQQTVKLVATDEPLTITPQTQSGAFQGTATDKTFTETDMAAKDYYVLSGGSAFAPVKGKGTIAAHKCWLEFAKNNGNARSLKIVFDNGDATGVNEVIEVNEVSDDTLYDLNGRKLNAKPTRKGVYIKNGQKVVK